MRGIFWLTLVLLTLVQMGSFLQSPGINREPEAGFNAMIDGTAHRPFVTRRLLPDMIRAADLITPDLFKERIRSLGRSSSTFSRVLARLGLNDTDAFRFFVYALLTYGFLWIFLLSFRSMVRGFYENDGLCDVMTLIAAFGVPAVLSYTYIYDISTLAIFTLGLFTLGTRRWYYYLAVLALATYSKETSVLLIGLFYFMNRNWLDRKLLYERMAFQIVIFLLVRVSLLVRFSENPGTPVEFHFIQNFLYGYHYSIGLLVAWIVIAAFVYHKWNEKPEFFRTALFMLPVLVVLTLFFGFLNEERDFAEAYPVVAVLFVHGLGSLAGLKTSLKEPSNGS